MINVEYEEVKKWLKQSRDLNKEINELILAKQEAFEIATGGAIDYAKDRVQSGGNNGTEQRLIRYVDYEILINKSIDKLVAVKNKIFTLIQNVDDSKCRTLLISYYINCKTLEQIAEDMEYDIRWVHSLHKKSIKKVEEILNSSL